MDVLKGLHGQASNTHAKSNGAEGLAHGFASFDGRCCSFHSYTSMTVGRTKLPMANEASVFAWGGLCHWESVVSQLGDAQVMHFPLSRHLKNQVT